MKKLWIVLISLALVAAFCMPASAVDVKFSGSYYVAGDYYKTSADNGDSYDGFSTAFFRERLRVQTEFVVSPGLSLITRFDALEKMWGDNSWAGSRGDTFGRGSRGNWDSQVQENIEFEQAYIQYMSKVGLWWIGYAPHDFWGTTFGDSTRTQALIQWILPTSWGMVGAKYFKSWEGSGRWSNDDWEDNGNDRDDNAYVLIGMYKTQNLETGLKVAYRRIADNRGDAWEEPNYNLPPNEQIKGWLLTPYFIGQFGPVKLQAELEYWNGKIDWENSSDDTDMECWATYLDATATFGPGYVGGRFIYASGQDPDDDDITGSNFSQGFEACWGGVDLKQTLILWNEDVANWLGQLDSTVQPNGVKNAYFYQIYGGYKWQDFDFFGSIAYAKADEYTQKGQDGKDYGWEFDATATYSITNNLSYMVGFGYLKAGDYFKVDGDQYLDDLYVLTNKLTLTF